MQISRKIYGFKGLIWKIFRNKDLASKIALKMVLGQLRGPYWLTGTLFTAPFRWISSHGAGWKSVMADTIQL